MKIYQDENGRLIIDGEGIETIKKLTYDNLPENTLITGFYILNDHLEEQ